MPMLSFDMTIILKSFFRSGPSAFAAFDGGNSGNLGSEEPARLTQINYVGCRT
jgi:hypothetical protein